MVTGQPLDREQRVSPLELFFDLVFVFGFTQVTTVLSDNSTCSVSRRRCCADPHCGLRTRAVKPLLWLAALGVGLFGPLFVDLSGWRVHPAHFVERHGLIVIIAIGFGARGSGLGTAVIVAAVLGFVVAASFWLAYFDFFTIRAQHTSATSWL